MPGTKVAECPFLDTVVPVGGYSCTRFYPFLVTFISITRVPVLEHFARFVKAAHTSAYG